MAQQLPGLQRHGGAALDGCTDDEVAALYGGRHGGGKDLLVVGPLEVVAGIAALGRLAEPGGGGHGVQAQQREGFTVQHGRRHREGVPLHIKGEAAQRLKGFAAFRLHGGRQQGLHAAVLGLICRAELDHGVDQPQAAGFPQLL